MTPDQLAHDLDNAASALEFAHRIPPGVFAFIKQFMDFEWTPDELDALSLFLRHRWTALELRDALDRAKEGLPHLAQFICSDTSLEMAAKLRDLEQRRILLNFLARWFNKQAGNDETEALRSLVGDAQLVIQGAYAIRDDFEVALPNGKKLLVRARVIDNDRAIAWLNRVMS